MSEGESVVAGATADASSPVASLDYDPAWNVDEVLDWVHGVDDAVAERAAFAVARENERKHPRKGVLDALTPEDAA